MATFPDGDEVVGAREHELLDTAVERVESIDHWWGPVFPGLEVTVVADG